MVGLDCCGHTRFWKTLQLDWAVSPNVDWLLGQGEQDSELPLLKVSTGQAV